MSLLTSILNSVPSDLLLAIGGGIGIATKAYALKDENTQWSRKASGFNLITYPFTGLLPFAAEGLWATASMTTISIAIWAGIYKYRAPENEDWKGNLTKDDIPFL